MVVPSRDVAAMRGFTRFYTRQVELLNESLLASRFSLSEARVLYELANRSAPTASDLARDLGLDAGYLSRILTRFERDGCLVRHPHPADARQSVLALTPAGRDAFEGIDEGAKAQVSGLLSNLTEAQRGSLVAAMSRIEDLLGRASVPPSGQTVILRSHRIGDLGWIARRQGMLYAAEYGWDGTFEALVAEILAAFVRSADPVRERAWIAERAGDVIGSVFLVRASDEVAKLRLLYVEPDARGSGLGARLVSECVTFARERGYHTLTLWTNDCLGAARRIYQAQGFALVAEDRHHSFGKDLVGQNWSLDL